jgi:hypothetical protein
MNKHHCLFTIVLLFFLLPYAWSQKQEKPKFKPKFGDITQEEIDMKQCSYDAEAPAVVLFDIGYCSPFGSYVGFSRHTRIKVFKKDADYYANFVIPYFRDVEQSVNNLKVSSYNFENGKLVETKAKDENIFDEKINKSLHLKKVIAPNVKEGTIFEIKYEISNPWLQEWQFQDEIPTLYSEYKFNIPEILQISKLGLGNTPYHYIDESQDTEFFPGSTEVYQVTKAHYVQKDVPAIKKESYMGSPEDYYTRLQFYVEAISSKWRGVIKILPTWSELSKRLIEDSDFGEVITRKSLMESEIEAVVTPGMTEKEKIQAIYDYIGKSYQISSQYNPSVLVSESFKTIKSTKKVSIAEKNLLFMNMLHNVGIKTNPVLYRTKDEGRVGTPLAVLTRYNAVMSEVITGNDTLYIDASGYPRPLKLMPNYSLSQFGMRIKKEGNEMIFQKSKLKTLRYIQTNYKLDENGKIEGEISITGSGNSAYGLRLQHQRLAEQKFKDSIFAKIISDGAITDFKVENPDLLAEENLKITSKFSTNNFITKTDGKLFLEPFLGFEYEDNPFKADTRLFPIDFTHPIDMIYTINITIPQGYTIEDASKPFRISIEDGSTKFDYLPSIKDNVLTINAKLNIKRTTYEVEEYHQLREVFNQMISKMSEQIVLTKL